VAVRFAIASSAALDINSMEERRKGKYRPVAGES
jgi:hypothetical protein